MIDADDEIIREARKSIQRAKICEPGKGEYVDECHWSKTGWAIWKFGDMKSGHYCTCRPAKAPFSPPERGSSDLGKTTTMTKVPKKLQTTVQVKDWGEPSINRLAVILIALEQMDARERSATFGFLKSKYDSEWPREPYT